MGCKKELPKMSQAISNEVYYQDTSCYAVATIIDGGDGIVRYGHCWAEHDSPTILDNVVDSLGTPNTKSFTNLICSNCLNNKLFIRPFTQDATGVHYGNTYVFGEEKPPELNIINIYQTYLDSLTVVSSINSNNWVFDRTGLCWSNSDALPSISDNTVNFITNKGEIFNSNINIINSPNSHFRVFTISNKNVLYSAAQSFTAIGKLEFYSDFNSESSLVSLEYPEVVQLSYNINNWEEARIEPSANDTGLFINHDLNEGFGDADGANFFAIDLNETTLDATKGSIEFTFEFRFDQNVSNDAYFFNTASFLSSHFNTPLYQNDISISAGWQGNTLFGKNQNFFFEIKENENGAQDIPFRISANMNDQKLASILQFSNNTRKLISFLWNANGIHGTNETMQMYFDGVKVAYSTQVWNAAQNLDRYFYLGTLPGYDSGQSHVLNAVKGIFLNFSIYNFPTKPYNSKVP